MNYTGIIESKKTSIVVAAPIHQYNFEETSGTSVIDSIGTLNGVNNGATINQTGFEGKCYQFDGVNDYIDYPSNLGISGFPFSVSFRVKQTVAGDRVLPLNGRSAGSYKGFDIDIRSNAIYVGYGNGFGDINARRTFFSSTAGINDTNWHKIAVEFIDVNTINIYKDSIYFATVYHSGSTSTSYPTDFNCTYKSMTDLSGPVYSKGFLDTLKIYNRLLNETEK